VADIDALFDVVDAEYLLSCQFKKLSCQIKKVMNTYFGSLQIVKIYVLTGFVICL